MPSPAIKGHLNASRSRLEADRTAHQLRQLGASFALRSGAELGAARFEEAGEEPNVQLTPERSSIIPSQ
jgi:hypothetical protein